MEYGRLSGKLHSDERWLSSDDRTRALVVSMWSWLIDHDREDGEIGFTVLHALSAGLGHGDDVRGASGVIDEMTTWGWIDEVPGGGAYVAVGWEPQAELMAAARRRREKERERYERRKAGT